MIDHTTQLQVPGRIADRHAEARARRLEREAAGAAGGTAGPAHARTIWLTDPVHAVRAAAGAVLARVGNATLRTGPTLRSSRHRA